jgi:ferredoxin-NADP reductase
MSDAVAASAHLAWREATVVAIRDETPHAKTFTLRLPQPARHRAGQHFVVRLTAPDGYTATRSYSVASPPDDTSQIQLTVERLEGGEVSTFLHDGVEVGDELEVRGPIGGWFVWDATTPAVLVGGGSGVVPLMAMLRLARGHGRADLLKLLVSVRSPDDLYYPDEVAGPQTTIVYTRVAPPGWPRRPGRLAAGDLPSPPDDATTAYVCGSPGFCDAVTDLLMAGGWASSQIRVERFGPSG